MADRLSRGRVPSEEDSHAEVLRNGVQGVVEEHGSRAKTRATRHVHHRSEKQPQAFRGGVADGEQRARVLET